MTTTTKAIDHIGVGEIDDRFPVKFVIVWEIAEYLAKATVYEAAYSSIGDETPRLENPEGGEKPEVVATFRWDGCGNWDFAPEGCMLHTCGRNDVQAFAEMMVHLHKRAHELISESEGGE